MDLVKAEIERKRNDLISKGLVGETKYFKRSLLKQKEDEDYIAKSKRLREQLISFDDFNYKTKTEEENLLLKKFEERSREEREKGKLMPRKEVIRLLRERNQPIRLFGENDYDTFQRLKRVELLEPESKGLRNDLIAALDKIDDADDEEFYASGRGRTSVDLQTQENVLSTNLELRSKETILSADELEEMKLDLARFITLKEGTATDDATAAVVALSKLVPEMIHSNDCDDEFNDSVIEHVLRYLKFLLWKWGHFLNVRPKGEKLSYSGKHVSAIYTQTVEYIKPLLRALQKKTCTGVILNSLVKIVVLMMDRNYLKANDSYLELAIGNAPWPLGVTNHGIHSRTAQERIYAKNVAHVLNDETQRKYIQAIKRLMTQCQNFFPSDPSKSVNYLGSC